MSAQARSDENLLFGIIALQMDFISRDALIAAMHAWVLDKAKPLGQILREQQALNADEQALLQALVQKHIQKHGGDIQKSLAAVSSVGSVREQLQQVVDAELHASLAHVAHAESVDPFPTRPPTVGEPTSLGLRFRILRPHAKGGLGEVFVAQDTELHREVALKEIRDRHADNPDSRARFLLEAEITGGLEHPGIVPVYGLGQYADGRPYYAMRFIPGDSLQEAIARFHKAERSERDPGERALELRQMLGRFVDVCDAIAYAHSRGVLHRDLKPGNVMLGPYGETLVVDWGLAKPMGSRVTEENGTAPERLLQPQSSGSATPTQMGRAIGTPAYMPPEQAAGRLDELGPASDVYSLGAMLYSLLTGVAPFVGGEVGEVLRRVQAGEFPRPRQVRREVPAALEAVCLKAMALRREQRYPTPRALAADVERWLADEPVSAWREPLRLRVDRWARRHQTLMAAAATGVLVLVLAAGTGAWWLDRQRTEQRRGVESALAEVERLQEQDRWSEARAVLGQTRERLGQSAPRDLQQRLDQGERNLDLVARLDAIRLKRGTIIEGEFDLKGADRDYEKAFRDLGSIEVNSAVQEAAAQVQESAVRDVLLAALDDWAICAKERQRRTWLLSVARAADANPWRKRARDPANWEDKTALMRLMTEGELSQQSPELLAGLAGRLQDLGGDAEPLFRTAHQRHPGDFWVNFGLGSALHKKRPTDAIGYYRAALALRPSTSATHYNLGIALRDIGQIKEAVAAYQKAIELDPKWANAHYNLGIALMDIRRFEDAVGEYRKAIELDPKLAGAHGNLGITLRRMGRFEEAVTEFQKVIELDPRSANAHNGLGLALYNTGRLVEAVGEYRKAIELDPKLAGAHVNLGVVLKAIGRFEEAVTEYRKAIELDPKLTPAHENLVRIEHMLALDKELTAFLEGSRRATDTAEQLTLVELCRIKKRYAAAVRFYTDAFTAQPKLADELRASHRYNAACFAALAASGQGEDAAKLDAQERARLRQQARDWLRAELALRSKQIEKGTPQERAEAQTALGNWQQDADLAGLRDKDAVEKLPEAERADCRKLWEEVATLLKKTEAKKE